MRSLSLQAQVTITIVVSLVLIDVIGAAVAEQHFRAIEQRNVSEDAATSTAAMKHVVDLRLGAMGLRAREAVETAGYAEPDQVMRELMRAGFAAVVVLGANDTVLSAGGDAATNDTLRSLMISRAPPQNYPAQLLRFGDGWLTVAARSTGIKHAVVGAMSQSYVEGSFLGDVLAHPTDESLVVLRDGTVLASSQFDRPREFFEEGVPRYDVVSASILPSFVSGHFDDAGAQESFVVASAPLEVMDGRVVRLVPSSTIDARVQEMAMRFFAVSTASYLLVGAVVLLSIAYAMRPLRTITEAARRLGRGDEDLKLRIRSRDELGLLAEVMNQSAAAIGEARRRQEAHAEESRLAAEAFQVAVGGLARAVAEAETQGDIAGRLADAILHVTPARAVAVSHDGRILGAACASGGGRHEVEALLASASDAFAHTRMGSGDDAIDIAILPHGEGPLVSTDQRKVEILGTQAVFAFHRARATESLRSAHQAMDQLVHQKQMFLDILSHDLKNPLTVARGRLELLARRDPALAERAAPIEASLDRVAGLIDEAVLFSRLEKDAQLDRPATDLVALVADAVGAIRPLAAQKGVAIAVQGPPVARWPAHSLVGRAVENLVSNAVKWSPHDASVEVILTTTSQHATIRIQDHGPGIPEADRARLFARFERADRSGVQGTGLGLAIAKRVVEMHAGHIAIEETPGGGATFVITLPFQTESRSSCPPQAGIGGAP